MAAMNQTANYNQNENDNNNNTIFDFSVDIFNKLTENDNDNDSTANLQEMFYFPMLILSVIGLTVSCFGCVVNPINAFVFYKMGGKDPINIPLLGLSIADLLVCLFGVFVNIFGNPMIADYINETIPDINDIVLLIDLPCFYPFAIFAQLSNLLTTFVTFERCLCVLLPLKIKTILTPKRSKIVTIAFFVLLPSSFSPIFILNSIQYVFDPEQNRSFYKTIYTEAGNEAWQTLNYFTVYVYLLGTVIFATGCSILLLVQLKKQTKWRRSTVAQATASSTTTTTTTTTATTTENNDKATASSSSNKNKNKNNSNNSSSDNKSRRVTRMVILINALFITSALTPLGLTFGMMFSSDFAEEDGKYYFINVALHMLASISTCINASFNIFIYYSNSSTYKTRFDLLFRQEEKKLKM